MSKIKNEANCRYEKQLEQDIVRNFATVETANVQITLPEKETIFDEEKAKGTAAITVGVKRGQLLTADRVAGIQQMISAAVPGVKAEEVSVIDSKKVSSQKGQMKRILLVPLLMKRSRDAASN